MAATPEPTATIIIPATPLPSPPPSTPAPTATPLPPATPTTVTGRGLAPGLMRAPEFYKTYSPVQSKFTWGARPFQMGPTFNEQVALQGAGRETPWGLQSMFGRTLSYDELLKLAQGQQLAPGPVVPAAERRMAYDPEVMAREPVAQVVLNPEYRSQAQPAVQTITGQQGGTTPVDKMDARYQNVISALGPNWEQQQRDAAARGDWSEYYRIDNLVRSIMSYVETGE